MVSGQDACLPPCRLVLICLCSVCCLSVHLSVCLSVCLSSGGHPQCCAGHCCMPCTLLLPSTSGGGGCMAMRQLSIDCKENMSQVTACVRHCRHQLFVQMVQEQQINTDLADTLTPSSDLTQSGHLIRRSKPAEMPCYEEDSPQSVPMQKQRWYQ